MIFKIFLVCVAVLVQNASAACPRLIPKSEWGSRPATSTSPLEISPVPYITIHHGESASCSSESSCASMVRSYQNQHMDVNGWSDIGYNFIVGGDGSAFVGRGWDNAGAHAPGFNFHSIGICFIGSFMSSSPTAAALQTVQDLMDCGVELGKVQSWYEILGHRQAVSTDCPGDTLYSIIQTWPRWTPNPDPLVIRHNLKSY